MAIKSDFIVKSGIRVAANATVNGAASISGNLTISPTAALIVNSTSGTVGQVLTSNGTAVYWANAAAGTNTDARYTWTNTHTFQSVVTFGNTSVNSTINSTVLSIQSITANLTGNVAATTLSGNLTGNVVGNVVATTLSGNLTGNVAAVTITGNLTGNVVATSVNATTINATANIIVGSAMLINTSAIQVGNSTIKTTINTTAFNGNVVATTISGNLTGNVVATTISGNLTGNVSATTISGNLTAVTASVTDKLQIGTPGSFDFGSNAVIEVDANGNTYVQMVLQNANTGNNASADLVVTNDTGNDSFNYVDLGINGSNYDQAGYAITEQNDAYLYASDGNLVIGTKSAKDLVFHAGGTDTTDRKLTINSTAVVFANSSALVANASTGTAGQVLHSNGTGVYWAADDQGVTSVASGNGITGGTITSTGTLSVVAGAGVVVNATGVHVNATYINTISANSTTYLGAVGNFGNASGIYTSGLVNAATVNATTLQVGANFTANATQVTAADLLVTGNLVVNGTMVTLNTATLDVRDLNITLAKGTASAAAANGAGITIDGANATLTYINASNTWLSNINFAVGNSTSNVSINATSFVGNVIATSISGNLTGNVVGNTSGVHTGNVVATSISGNLTGNVVATSVNATTINATANIVVGANVLVNTSVLQIGNATANVFVNSTAFVGNVVATTVTGNLSGTAANATLLNNKTEGNLNVNSALYANASITNTFTVGTSTYFLSSGNVGIGTSSPGGKLEISGDIDNSLSSLGTADQATLTITNRNVAGLNRAAKTLYEIGNLPVASVSALYSVFNGSNDIGGSLVLSTQQNASGGVLERLRITPTGNVGIGNTAPTHTLRVDGTTSLAGAVSNITTLAAGNTTITGFINSTSTVTAVDFNSTSDIRYKRDIVKIEDALDKVYSLSGYTFTMNETGERSTGLIAQEVEKVLPEAVKGEDKKTLSYGNLIGLLVEAIKEQGKKIEELERLVNK